LQSRAGGRVPVSMRDRVFLDGNPLADSRVVDLSEEGAGLRLATPVPIGPLAAPCWALRIGDDRIRLRAVSVRRCQLADDGHWHAGLHWGPLDEPEARKLRRHLNLLETANPA
jgi:hypothetical protein